MKTIFVMMLALLSSAVVYSQQVSRSEAKVAELRMNARQILRRTPHRIRTTVEMRVTAEDPWGPYSSHIREETGPDRWHHIGQRLELIGVGGRTYEKLPDGRWQLKQSSYTGPTVSQVSKPVIETEDVAEAPTEGDGPSGRIVKQRARSTIRLIRDGSIVDLDGNRTEWYDTDGRLVRVETEHFNFERKKFQRNVEIYEYDSSISIEEPL
jgi:hypothetical protein